MGNSIPILHYRKYFAVRIADLIRDHGDIGKGYGRGEESGCASCGKDIAKERVIGSPWGGFCADCIEGLLKYVLDSENKD